VPQQAVTVERALAVLAAGTVTVGRQILWSSNATFLAEVADGATRLHAVYKPRSGEAPLWDFPAGTLCLREMAAFTLSEALGWRLVPPTVLRDGPYGFGALQAFIAHDPDEHYLSLPAPDPETVRRIAAFDVLVNNADRKSGHVLSDPQGRLWAIDHGVCFHADWKLRTVIWDFAGQPLPPAVADHVRRLVPRIRDDGGRLRAALAELLDPAEVQALCDRAAALTDHPFYPLADPSRRAVPWPPV